MKPSRSMALKSVVANSVRATAWRRMWSSVRVGMRRDEAMLKSIQPSDLGARRFDFCCIDLLYSPKMHAIRVRRGFAAGCCFALQHGLFDELRPPPHRP